MKEISFSNDYIAYILTNYPEIKLISLPYDTSINKYAFLYRLYYLFPFMGNYSSRCISLTLDSMFEILSQIINHGQPAESDFSKLYKNTIDQVSRLQEKFNKGESIYYDSISDIILKVAIICENVYLNIKEKNDTYTYKTSSFDIVHVLRLIEIKMNMNGIAFSTIEKGVRSYDFNKNISVISNMIISDYHTWNSTILDKYSKELILNMHLYVFYGEILLLIANEYNKQIMKELPYNEW